jgi:hypothetical protein
MICIGTKVNTFAKIAALGLLLGLTGAAVPVQAHHSFAMFDPSKQVTIAGTVKEFRWTNPHAAVIVYGHRKDGSDAPDLWSVELQSPGNLTHIGWTRHSLKPGDKVEILIDPLRDGSHAGSFQKATLVDTGEVLRSRTPADSAQ